MKICFVLARFPELSQTFVLTQVLDLLDRGHDIDIVAARPGDHAHLHPSVRNAEQRYSLSRRTTYSGAPDSLLTRTLSTPWKAVTGLFRSPAAVARAFDVTRFGWFALTGSVLHAARPLLGPTRHYDAIVAHFGPEGVIADALRHLRLISGPLVTFFHAYDLWSAPRVAGRNMYRTLFHNGERFLAISEHGAEALRDLGAPPARIQVHHMGIDVDKFGPVPERGPPSAVLRALSIGRLVAKKGFHDGIAGVASALRDGARVDYRIIGEGPERARLEALVRKLGVGHAVRLPGAAGEDAVLRAVHESDVLLAPSVTASNGDQEGIPMVLMEAQSAGLPVIATRHGGIPELVIDSQSGLLVPQADPEMIASALQRLASDPDLREQMGQRGRETVRREFNLGTQNAALETLLVELARQRLHDRGASLG